MEVPKRVKPQVKIQSVLNRKIKISSSDTQQHKERMNLREENEGINIILKQANRGIRKDKFSAFEYGLYYIKIEEDSKKRKNRKFNAKDWMFMN